MTPSGGLARAACVALEPVGWAILPTDDAPNRPRHAPRPVGGSPTLREPG